MSLLTAPNAEIGSSAELTRLAGELRDTRERLQATVEEYETAVEELRSSNEELSTTNLRLNSKIEEADRANSDLRNLFDSTQVGTLFLDERLAIRTYTPAVKQIFNLISSDRGRPLSDITANIEVGELPRELQSVLQDGEPIERTVRQIGGETHYMMRILPYRHHDDCICGVILTFVDISRTVESEAQQRMMVQELNHRVRNMLAVVDAIAKQTVAGSGTLESFGKAFSGRIRAMGAAYALVSAENWRNISLHDVLSTQLEAHADRREGRIALSGPAIGCAPNVALVLGMVIHELATNAAKYGALSSPFGRVLLTWAVDRTPESSTLRVHWVEKGGPPATAPTRRGFGTDLVRRELKHVLRGSADLVFEPPGLAATLTIPFRSGRIVQFEAEPAQRGSSTA